MKILVLSDSHGNYGPMEAALTIEKPELVIFLGDGAGDIALLERQNPSQRILKIKGNGDFFHSGAAFICDIFDGVKIYAVHGHIQRVKESINGILYAAKAEKAAIALYGHTHRQMIKRIDGITLINPGSIGCGQAYGVIVTDNGSFECVLKNCKL
ncbi:MAG: YfcE family phosphodiesterase [Eubacteriales bacterium]|nr:YfcE family phosphodiesterase [Eubacteriales bacterium]